MLRTVPKKGDVPKKGFQQRTGGWEWRIVDVSQHSSFVGLAIKCSGLDGRHEVAGGRGGG